MCFGSTNKATRAAEEAERQRQAEITGAQRRIEGIFSSPEREQQYNDFVASQRGYLQSDLNRTHADAQRQTKFATARSGLSGGSVDVDRNRLLAETYLRGTAEAERKAQNAGAELRGQDQASKQGLLSQALAGGDLTTLAQNANTSMRTNALQAKSDSTFNAFDGLFGDFGNIYKNSREAAGERRASSDYGSLFGPRPRTQASVSGGV